jgi:hypothetical protein
LFWRFDGPFTAAGMPGFPQIPELS